MIAHYENDVFDDTVSSCSTINDSDNDFSLKKYQLEIIAKKKSAFVKTSESSSDSIKIKLNNIEFDKIVKNEKLTQYYNMDKLIDMTFQSIYNVLTNVSYLIFVDNSKLTKKEKKKCFLKARPSLIETEFPGCTFFPIESIDIIKKNTHALNSQILNAESKSQKVYIDEEVCYGISFDEGNIIKNCLYKKMEIIDMIMFIPIEKYNIKQTEYKIRGFCQIVEELGAKSIDITFKTNNHYETRKSFETKINSEIEMIAVNLGLNTTTIDINDENYHYTLSYPANNTITLNEHMIRNKIKKKKFIISESAYNSNLELQYLVHSRCVHQINKYSTVFTFDNNNIIDHSIFSKLKTHGIEIGVSYKEYSMDRNCLSIITNVVFSSIDDYKNIINGDNISLDNNGFNFLIDNIRKSNNFATNGIYKIMVFINKYVEKVLKHQSPSQYKTIVLTMRKIKKVLTLTEYAELLCNHFNETSQWVHFINFIELLSNKTQSYDKLGYMIIISNNNISNENKIELVLRFIQHKCIEKKIEDKYWQMIQPYNIKLKNELKNKILYEYNFIQYYNWYSLNMFIQSIDKYMICFNNVSPDEHFKGLQQNMNVGYKNWEFYNNMIPFIIRQSHILQYQTKDELYLSSIFEKSLNIESFILSKMNTLTDLNMFIEKKINRIKIGYEWVNSLKYPITIEFIVNYINTSEFIDKHDYINKKLNIILGKKTTDRVKEWLEIDESIEISNDTMYRIINKLICYNDKLNINTVSSNYLGFTCVYNNYMNGIKNVEFHKLIVPFIVNHITDKSIVSLILQELTLDNFNTHCSSYYNLFIYLKTIMEKNKLDTTNIIADFII